MSDILGHVLLRQQYEASTPKKNWKSLLCLLKYLIIFRNLAFLIDLSQVSESISRMCLQKLNYKILLTMNTKNIL